MFLGCSSLGRPGISSIIELLPFAGVNAFILHSEFYAGARYLEKPSFMLTLCMFAQFNVTLFFKYEK